MKKLKCSDVSGIGCAFEAAGETNKEVKEKLTQHGHEAHGEIMHGMSDEDKTVMGKKMDDNIEDE